MSPVTGKNTCQVAWPSPTRDNAAYQKIVAGLTATLAAHDFAVELISPSSFDYLNAYNPSTGEVNWSFINTDEFWPEYQSISNGFHVILSTNGYEWPRFQKKLACGQVLWKDGSWMIGVSPFRAVWKSICQTQRCSIT